MRQLITVCLILIGGSSSATEPYKDGDIFFCKTNFYGLYDSYYNELVKYGPKKIKFQIVGDKKLKFGDQSPYMLRSATISYSEPNFINASSGSKIISFVATLNPKDEPINQLIISETSNLGVGIISAECERF